MSPATLSPLTLSPVARRSTAPHRPSRILRLIIVVALIVASFAAGAYVQRRSAPRAHKLVSLAAYSPGRVPGDFEHQDAILLGCNELIETYPKTLIEIVHALAGRVTLIGLVRTEEQREQVEELIRSEGYPADTMQYFVWPAVSMWVQDFGPLVMVGEQPRIVDFEYNYPNRGFDNLTPAAFASWTGLPLDHCNLAFEGGAWLSNGEGLCVVTNTLLNQNLERGHTLPEIGAAVKKHLNFETLSHLKPLHGEPLGHIDMFMAFTAPNVAVIASCDPLEDWQNAQLLDENAKLIEDIKLKDKKMRVVRIPMPTHQDGHWRTYTNVLFANGVLLVPQYPDVSPELDKKAIEIYQELLPDWKIVGIDSIKLIEHRGALHCVSLNIPMLPAAFSSD